MWVLLDTSKAVVYLLVHPLPNNKSICTKVNCQLLWNLTWPVLT